MIRPSLYISSSLQSFSGEDLQKRIIESYDNFKGELKVELKVVPDDVRTHVELDLTSDCKLQDKKERGSPEVTCKNVTVKYFENFNLKINLKPEICNLNESKRNFSIEVNVFQQRDSSLNISVGKILCIRVECVLLFYM